MLPLIILNQIAEGEERHEPVWGYRICELVESLSDGRLRLQAGTLYPVLASLEKSGLVRGEWGQNKSGPRRKYFHLTPKGRKALDEEVESFRMISKLAGSSVRARTRG
jgi:DNA-binding PadR family transcriptional regulator